VIDNQREEKANGMFTADLRGHAWLYCGAAACSWWLRRLLRSR